MENSMTFLVIFFYLIYLTILVLNKSPNEDIIFLKIKGNSAGEADIKNGPMLNKLYTRLIGQYDEAELQELCFALHVDYEVLNGTGKNCKARALVLYMNRHGRLTELENKVNEQRPDFP